MQFDNQWLNQVQQDVTVNLIHPKNGATKTMTVKVKKHGLSLREKLAIVYQTALRHFADDINDIYLGQCGMPVQKAIAKTAWDESLSRNHSHTWWKDLPIEEPVDNSGKPGAWTKMLAELEKAYTLAKWPCAITPQLPLPPSLEEDMSQWSDLKKIRAQLVVDETKIANMNFSVIRPKNMIDAILGPLWGKDK